MDLSNSKIMSPFHCHYSNISTNNMLPPSDDDETDR